MSHIWDSILTNLDGAAQSSRTQRHVLSSCVSLLQVRRRSKACKAGLKELDELVAIGQQACSELSHAEAMSIIDTQSAALNLRVKRSKARSDMSAH